jgi:hypothetical protein
MISCRIIVTSGLTFAVCSPVVSAQTIVFGKAEAQSIPTVVGEVTNVQ